MLGSTGEGPSWTEAGAPGGWSARRRRWRRVFSRRRRSVHVPERAAREAGWRDRSSGSGGAQRGRDGCFPGKSGRRIYSRQPRHTGPCGRRVRRARKRMGFLRLFMTTITPAQVRFRPFCSGSFPCSHHGSRPRAGLHVTPPLPSEPPGPAGRDGAAPPAHPPARALGSGSWCVWCDRHCTVSRRAGTGRGRVASPRWGLQAPFRGQGPGAPPPLPEGPGRGLKGHGVTQPRAARGGGNHGGWEHRMSPLSRGAWDQPRSRSPGFTEQERCACG